MDKIKVNNVEQLLLNQTPSAIVFAPNYWQWFSHHQNHGIMPDEIKHCETQLDLINYLGLDVFSRNIYCKQDDYWFGGICDEYFNGLEMTISTIKENNDKITDKEYHFKSGILKEQLRYVFNESTVVQKKFLITDYNSQAGLLEEYVASRRWKFDSLKFKTIQEKVGDAGIVVLGDFFSPLKMLHLVMNPVQTVYFMMEQPVFAKSLLELHEIAQLDIIEQCVKQGVKVVMAMDNLDTMFHPPMYVEEYSASFYEKASSICHVNGAKFFIHACGNQKDNLPLIASYGVDGLEGVAFPPFGDIELDEAMRLTPDHFIITGGISPVETRDLKTKEEVFNYVKNLFARMRPYKNRFVFSSSCNTAINTSWDTIKHFRDAWLEYMD